MNVTSFIPLVLYGLIYLLAFVIWLGIKKFLKQNENNKKQLITKNRVVRNHDVFINTLEKQERLDLPEPVFVLGNKDADLELTIFTSLYCEMCRDMGEIIDQIIFAYQDEIKINIFFKTQAAEEKNNHLYVLHSIFLFRGEKEFLQALNFWFKNKNLKKWKIDEYKAEENKETFKSSNEWFSQNGIISTPSVFIDGYVYPYEFEKEDLYYHIEQIIENK
jgi:glutaredoxin